MADIANGVQIVAIVAPAAVTAFENIYRLNGYLKSIGVKAVFDVSFGAELAAKSYLEYIKDKNPQVVIAQPCAALVRFCEIYHSELLPYLAPVHSPMLHTAIMIRQFFPKYAGAKIAAISPCLAKKREFEETMHVEYNVSMIGLKQHLADENVDIMSFDAVPYDGPVAERAVTFSSPGGLRTTVLRDAPELDFRIRRIEGNMQVYQYLRDIPQMILEGNTPLIVDCLSCMAGCNGGLGSGNYGLPLDRLEAKVERRMKIHISRNKKISDDGGSSIGDLIAKYWKPAIYNRIYQDLSGLLSDYRQPTETELKNVYKLMKKQRESDFLNCAACGYGNCRDMAVAIFNGLNRAENCHQYLNIELDLRSRLLHETFGRYLSDDIVNSLLESPKAQALGGRQRNISVLMSDLRGFTGLSEMLDVDKLVPMLNHYFSLMVEVMHKYNGTVIEFMGDGILTIFGAPVDSTTHADDAIACAIMMQNTMSRVNEWNKENGYPSLKMGIGINTGECIVGNIGADKTMKYNVIGKHVNLCGRIESYTSGGQIYISEYTRDNTKAKLKIMHTEKINPKGIPQPISIFLVRGIGFPYSLDENIESVPVRLIEPLIVSSYSIHGKHVETDPKNVRILAISEHEAVVACRELNILENLRLCSAGYDVFAKVSSKIKDYCYRLSFTSDSSMLLNRVVFKE
ncbi:MAG: hypothetical protein Ta2F_03280 [Termitinemataceae bacterium]|nr:MAG: hypothetical protein Ta2F_03280 [Termitinemataceae bacterium]